MNTNQITAGTPFDATFLFKFVCVVSTGILLAILGFIIIGAVAFYRNTNGAADTFIALFLRGEILKILTVSAIAMSVVYLAFARIVDGATAASILSGVTGYVLGGLSLHKPEAKQSEKGPQDK
jgi:hypothetical protein